MVFGLLKDRVGGVREMEMSRINADRAHPLVYVVILNWNGWQDTLVCVRSLKRSDYTNLQIVVVDNNSQDESISRIRESYPDIALIETRRNLGFAGGNNVGIRFALDNGADYVFVLNNDTYVASDCVSNLVNFAISCPHAALLGPKIYDAGTEVYRQWAVKSRLSFWSILWILSPFRRLIYDTAFFRNFFYTSDQAARVYAVPGSAMFFNAEVLEKIGLFDEQTFLYWEEFIVAEKLYRLGLPTYVVPQAVIWHKESASISKIGARKFIENVKSETYFVRKYLGFSPIESAILRFIRLAAYLGRCTKQSEYRSNLGKFLRVFLSI